MPKTNLLLLTLPKTYNRRIDKKREESTMADDTPSAFSVAHYVLLFLVSTLCTISVVWVLIAANNRESTLRDKIRTQTTKTCQRDVADKITNMWEKEPHNIPKYYKNMEHNYANRIVEVRTTGTCNGEKFVCKMGAVRSSCDPCALNSAQKRALFQHVSDIIDQTCKKD